MMQTFTGKEVDPLCVKPSDICLEDYMRSLSMSCRFNGHLERYYSVLNHCLNMAQWFYDQGRFKEAKYAAFHEGDEMFFGDIITPVKYLDEFAAVRELIKDAQRAVYKHFKLYGATPKTVKELDDIMKVLEARKVKPLSKLAQHEVPELKPKIRIRVLTPKKCEEEFRILYDKIETALATNPA
jgi:5'-deoxynucleotidase YfbR-like HD superfamily hydrolase